MKHESERERDFANVSDLPTFVTDPERPTFLAVSERLSAVTGVKKLTNCRKHSWNDQKHSQIIHANVYASKTKELL